MEFNMDQRVLPVQLLWDRSNVVPIKHSWNLFDKLRTSPHGSLSLASKEKSVLHTRQRSGVLIEALEPDDSDEERPLNSRRRTKYQLRFVNKVCETYYTRDQIKADDGNLLMVALFDENNTKITSGPLSSASVEVVVLHGDFNVNGQDYWTSEEFSRSVVCPPPGDEASSVLGGDRSLVLVGGEACLGDTFFQRTSFSARTAKFKMGVRLLESAHEERIQEGISEPFEVKDRRVEEVMCGIDGATSHKAPPPGFRFQPTHKELVDHLYHRCLAKPLAVDVIAEVDIYKFDAWDLPAKAVFGEDEWYFFSRPAATSGTLERYRTAGSGYWNWKATDEEEMAIPLSAGDDKIVGFKKTLIFYTGDAPNGSETNWIMDEYRLSTLLEETVLCKIYTKPKLGVQSSYEQVPRLGQQQPTLSVMPQKCHQLSELELHLPPGFRFYPSDEELVCHYLCSKITNTPCGMVPRIIGEVDLHEHEPWELPDVARLSGEREWYFFSRNDRKYATYDRTNRATQSGYWKATGKERTITALSAAADHDKAIILGKKKMLVFYKGRAPSGERTNWLMHEYCLHDDDNLLISDNESSYASSTSARIQDQWVLCKIMYKTTDEPDQLATTTFLQDRHLQQLLGRMSDNMDDS